MHLHRTDSSCSFVFLPFFSTSPRYVQSPGFIAGTVVDPSGAAIPNATVRLEMSGRTIDEFHTGIDGRFEFRAYL